MRHYKPPERNIVISSAVVSFVAILAAFSHIAIARQLHTWKLLPEPERLTELYFTHPRMLPAVYTPGTSQNVSFTAHNLEYRTTNYSYVISERAATGGTAKVLATGTFTLKQNQTKVETRSVVPADLGTRADISVSLTNVNDSIDYWVDRSGV